VKKIILLVVLLPLIGFSQEGKPLKSIAIPSADLPKPDIKPETTANAPQYSISKPFEPKLFKVPPRVYEAPKEESKNKFGDKKSDLNPSLAYEKKLNNQKTEKLPPNNTSADLNFGALITKSEYVILLYRDYDAPDFDKIAIYVDDMKIKNEVVLEVGFSSVKSRLIEGSNILSFIALNEGFSTPNTAQFQIQEIDGKIIYDNYWGLLRGNKATINLVRINNPSN